MRMTVRLNQTALEHARQLIKDARAVRDGQGDWGGHAPDAGRENTYLKHHGYEEYAKWHLGEDPDQNPETKGRYSFPYGDFQRLHRCAVIAAEVRAAQNDHDDITDAAKALLAELERD